MDKPLPQITFDFDTSEPAPAPNNPASAAAVGKVAGPPTKKGRKALKDVDAALHTVQVPPDEVLFQKQYYAIGDVAAMFNENISLIRFWENEFDILEPRKNRKGDRMFKPQDIKNLELIYDLLRRRKFTLEGAKAFLRKNKHAREQFEMVQSLQKLKGFLLQLKASL